MKLTIDNRQVEVEPGKTVLEAARKAGIYIPTLCYHPALKPYGGCRLCIVEIEKMRGLNTACTVPAGEGMVVKTNTPQLQELRKGILELILTEHPHLCLLCDRKHRCEPFDICLRNVSVTERCVLCPKNRQCELQRLIDYIGIKEITLPYKYKDVPVHKDPLIARDYNLCVLCGRCVQMCQEVRGIGAISFVNRGSSAVVSTAFDKPLKDSGCRFCGACVEVCPTGALMDEAAKYKPDAEREEVVVPCHYACPAHINVPLYVYLAGAGKYQDSLAVVREKVPFPGVLGRVCIHPCEAACRRGSLNEPISIKFLKRFVSDRDTGEWKKSAIKMPRTGKKVAIIGSGPAGLTAGFYLAKLGHAVTVYEALSQPGGMMRVGIPEYRLPRNVLDKEINIIREAGVDIKLNSRVDSVDTLFEQGFNAVFIAVGAHLGGKMRVKGEDSTPGVVDGATFLRKAGLGEKVDVGQKVAVVGGGNVAIDSARVAQRLGAKEIKIIYRRGREEMPASPEEVEAAIQEGIEFNFLANPVGIAPQDGKVNLTCVRMELGAPDASGRRQPVPVKGSEFSSVFDTVIAAIGQMSDVPAGFNVKTGRGNVIEVDKTNATSRGGVWAGGDVTNGPASVIEAIASARVAASAIDKYLGGRGIIDEELTTERQIGMCVGLDTDFATKERVKMPELPVEKRTGFVEVETGLEESQAVCEGKRCFQCGVRLQIPAAPMAPLVKKYEACEPEKAEAKS